MSANGNIGLGTWFNKNYGDSDTRNHEDLRKIHEQEKLWNSPEYKAQKAAKERAERERLAAIRATKLEKFQAELGTAKGYIVAVESSGDEAIFPVVETQGSRGEKRWAVIGENCFPIYCKFGTNKYWLDESAIFISIEQLLDGFHASIGFRFETW